MELQNLKELRKKEAKTQKEMADYFHVSLKTYNQWETGGYEPDIRTLIQMADFFHTTIDYIVGRTTNELTPEEKKILNMAADIIKEKLK